ncbi:hypothetical protein EV05_0196 [Prochlorococcus sp. MIT 0601]|nr:hypothetical protein EV05_0196 [Prochlorococcus sp. MIT 0601]
MRETNRKAVLGVSNDPISLLKKLFDAVRAPNNSLVAYLN